MLLGQVSFNKSPQSCKLTSWVLSIVFQNCFFSWKKAIIWEQEISHKDMHDKTDFHVLNWSHRKRLTKCSWSFVVSQQEWLLIPILHCEEHTCKWVQQWTTCAIEKYTPQVCKVLWEYLLTFNFRTSIELIQITLKNLLCLYLISFKLFKFWATSVPASYQDLFDWSLQLRQLRNNDLEHKCWLKGLAYVVIKSLVKALICSVEQWDES